MIPGCPFRLALRIGCTAAAAAALALPPGAASAAWPFGASGPAEPTHEIKAPHYGDALFYFFQDRYFTSITTLMASQPNANANMAASGKPNLPDPMKRIR